MEKKLVIIGGANGVGKTTFAYRYKEEYQLDYLGADEIAEQLATSEVGKIEMKAARVFFRNLNRYFHVNQSLIIESTLSGVGLAKQIKRFQKIGYAIHIVYVFIDDVNLCKQRIKARVLKGGHNVPEQDIVRRYYRSIENFKHVYLPLANTWQLLYNGWQRPFEVAFGEYGKTTVIDEKSYKQFMEVE